MLTDADLRALVSRASTIDERLAGEYVPVASPDPAPDPVSVQNLLDAWRQEAGGTAQFLARLAADGYAEAAVLRLLGPVQRAADAVLPAWAEDLRWIAPALARGACSPRGETLPFAELLWPAVVAAERRLRAFPGLIAAQARADLTDALLTELCRACAAPLFRDFALFRQLHRMSLGGLSWHAETAASDEIFRSFLVDCRQRIGTLLLTSPVLARMIGTIVGGWLARTAEMLERLAADRAAIAAMFCGGADPGLLTHCRTGLSDPHRGRRSVAILGFEAGITIVYKPKDLRIDAAWHGLLHWLAARGAPIALRAPQVLARAGHGWAAFITPDEPGPGTSPFHRRAGALLALLHLLQARDMHAGNVITQAEHPVLIDLETLFHPDVAPAGPGAPDPATQAAQVRIAGSPLATHYLALWMAAADGRLVAMGGIEGFFPEPDDAGFLDVNTDMMRRRTGAAARPRRSPPPENRAADVVAGFSAMHGFLAAHRSALAATLAAGFRDLPVRAVITATRDYQLAKRRAENPANLTDGAAWSLRFERLGRGIGASHPADPAWRLFAAERRALADLDVPFFTAVTSGTWLDSGDAAPCENCFADTPLNQVLSRLAAMGDDDRAMQCRLIRAALPPPRRDRADRWRPDVAPVTAAAAIAAARRIGATLCEAAIRADEGAAWLGTVPLDHDHGTLNAAGTDLYAGTLGIALFLAALARVARDAPARALALAAVASARRLHAPAETGAYRMRIGGAAGIGSVIYALVRIATLLGEPAVLADATRMSRLITPDSLAADRTGDVQDGAAGAILGLLALHRTSGEAAVLERAVLCGRHLGSAGMSHGPGFAHGVDGRALALTRLHAAIGEPAPRTPPSDPATLGPGWCRGAAGVGLAGLGMIRVCDDPAAAAAVDAAVGATLAAPIAAHDHLCCGNFGCIEFLLAAGTTLRRTDLVEAARRRTADLLAHAAVDGFCLEGGEPSLQPGFFRGLSGIGYQLLRIADLDLPSVLLWDS